MPTVPPAILLLVLVASAAVAQEPAPRDDPADAIRAWVESDLADRALLDAAVTAVLDAERDGIAAVAAALRATKPGARERRIALETLVSSVVVGALQRGVESGMRYAGQYDALRELQPFAGRQLLILVLDTPQWFPDDMRSLVVPALRDVFPKAPDPNAVRRMREMAADVERESQALREALSYALAGWGDRELVEARIAQLTKDAGDASDTDELWFVRELARVHYELRDYAAAAAEWRRYVKRLDALDVDPGAIHLYEAACATALSGAHDEALTLIERCAELVGDGRVDSTIEITRKMFESDPDLRSIRGTERFAAAQARAFPDEDDAAERERRR